MRIKPAIMFLPIIIGFISCQKEYSIENGNPTLSTSGILVRYTLKDDLSALESNFDYNAGNKMIAHRLSAVAGSFSASVQITASRNGNNQITRATMVLKSVLNPAGDTINYVFTRNAAGRILYYTMLPTDIINNGYDSIVCTYNAANKLTTQIVYAYFAGGGAPQPIQRVEMTYNGNNMVNYKDFELLGSLTAAQLAEEVTYEFDDKPAALATAEDEFLVGLGLGEMGVNNVTKESRVIPDDVNENTITEKKYVYGTNGKPTSAEVTTTRPGLPARKGTATFFYQ